MSNTAIPLDCPAPDFELPATTGDTVRLSSLQGLAIVALVFLRGFG